MVCVLYHVEISGVHVESGHFTSLLIITVDVILLVDILLTDAGRADEESKSRSAEPDLAQAKVSAGIGHQQEYGEKSHTAGCIGVFTDMLLIHMDAFTSM